MNLADPELEFIDPTPNVHSLFIHFDTVFFWAKLGGKAVVRWSKRMYSCAGICSYEGRGGICDIALSEPLLKLRPRKDLVETLLHEMIHAYLFVVGKDQSRNGHGPNFLSHMYRINQAAGINISVYHDFHDEVKLYQNHVWRCNGPCQKMRPYFGICRRSMNKPPGPTDVWWNTHKRVCGGTFIKCQEPEKVSKPVKQTKKVVSKHNADITKYINNNNATVNNKNKDNNIKSFNDPTSKLNKVRSPKLVNKPKVFTGSGHISGRPRSNSLGVIETVRNVWANKTIPSAIDTVTRKIDKVATSQVKRLSDVFNSDTLTPPKKIMKIDDYFKKTASSILKDVYGKEFTVTQSDDANKLKAVAVKETLVECPICNAKVNSAQINKHIDECLNKDVIEKLSKETIVILEPSTSQSKSDIIKKIKEPIEVKPAYKSIEINVNNSPITINRHTIDNITLKSEIKLEKDLDSPCAPIKIEPSECIDLTSVQIKEEGRKTSIDRNNEPSTSRVIENHTCPCCGKKIDKSVLEHLDECLIFIDNNTTIPEEGESSFGDRTIVIDDSDDEFDETQTFNATGTKSPCPCCMKMVEAADMNAHLDVCLGSRV